jgi:putative membrane protein
VPPSKTLTAKLGGILMMMNGMMYGMSMMGMWMMMVFGFLLWAIIIGVVVYLAVLLIKSIKGKDKSLMLLKERFAKGEISEEEYRQKRKILDED